MSRVSYVLMAQVVLLVHVFGNSPGQRLEGDHAR